MLLLSFLVEVLFTSPLPMSFHNTLETCSLVIAVFPCQSCFHLLLPFASLGGKGYLPLLVGPTNKEDDVGYLRNDDMEEDNEVSI